MDYWADLELVHRFRCFDNMALNTKYHRLFVLVLCQDVIIEAGFSLVISDKAMKMQTVNNLSRCVPKGDIKGFIPPKIGL